MQILTNANQARLDKCLNQLYRVNDKVMTLKQRIDTQAISYEAKEVPSVEYNRHKWNSMNNEQQKEYQKKLDKTKTSYRVYIDTDTFFEIPKIVFEAYTQPLEQRLAELEQEPGANLPFEQEVIKALKQVLNK